MLKKSVTIVNRLGLHARAAAKFVGIASGYVSEIHVERSGRRVNGKSIMGVMMLAASRGTEIILELDGPDEAEALAALTTLIANRFDEPQ